MFSSLIFWSLAAALAPFGCALLLAALGLSNLPLALKERVAFITVRFWFGLGLLAATASAFLWVINGRMATSHSLISLDIYHDYHLHFNFFIDGLTISYSTTAAIIANIIGFFSHRYLHRDPGFVRFFIVISFFYFGINIILLAGSLDLIFAGWEIVGISSFLLIGYFWHRPKAIVAARRAYYIFRFCDLGMLAGVLIAHFYWHDAGFFQASGSHVLTPAAVGMPVFWQWVLSLCILLPVIGKSAQFPLSFWLPRAMEGPTHSSAIFYGSLSIHAGVFLLIRTMHIWSLTPGFPYLLAAIGLITTMTSTLFAHVQSNIKGQIGYSSIAQVGIMLIELSLGFQTLALCHMVGNAFLRCFQLLVSSSILTTHMQLQSLEKPTHVLDKFSWTTLMPASLSQSLYIFAINEGYIERGLNKVLVRPLIWLGQRLGSALFFVLPTRHKMPISSMRAPVFYSLPPWFLLTLFAFGGMTYWFDVVFIQHFLLVVSLILCLVALAEKNSPSLVLSLVVMSYFCGYLSNISIKTVSWSATVFIFAGLGVSCILAFEAICHIKKRKIISSWPQFLGLFHYFPLAGTMLLLGALGIMALPLSTSFFGEDLLLHMSLADGFIFLAILHIILVLNGITLIHMVSSLLFGQKSLSGEELNLDYRRGTTAFRVVIFIVGNLGAYLLFI
jgi:NADH-quinone oxidoreductase subunit L